MSGESSFASITVPFLLANANRVSAHSGLCSQEEERLVRDLFRGYNKLIRPVQNMTEKVDEMRAKCKAEGVPREETKAKVSEVEKQITALRRKGVKALKSSFAEVVENDEQTLTQKVAYFDNEANLEVIRE